MIDKATVAQMKAQARKLCPKPKEANRIARETNSLVLASDGNLYTGATKEEAAAGEKRRTIVWGIRDAVETLAAMKMLPHEFLNYALPHQLWDKEKEGQIKEARDWLNALYAAWEQKP